jgi:hypothetical protein
VIRLLLATAIACAQPATYEYFRYGDAKSIEQPTPQPARPPFDFHFPNPPAPTRKVCALENRPGVFWFTPNGKPLNHTFVTPAPSEFRITTLEQKIRGFSITAAFSGTAKREGAVEAAYFADRDCSDASLEYGFSRDLATDSILVYWATYANCGNDAFSLCRKTDDGTLGENFSNVRQENSGTKVNHGFRIYGLDFNRPYTFKIAIEPKGLRIEVWDDNKLAQSFFKETEPWFPLTSIDGYIITGTQIAGDPQISGNQTFRVSNIQIAK